ncbi:MAG: leucine-rich repeat domain-containing protein [Bacteroidetes bacterium]|nr:leucine-rich repeat domain-containing protein [Bacteroidota bacterium]
MFKSKHYQGNGALIEHSHYTSSYADVCSDITTNNAVETTTRGGATTKRVVELLQAPRPAELVSASPDLTRRFRNKFGMALCVTLLICAFATANLSAQTTTITSITGSGTLASAYTINGGPITGETIIGAIILAKDLDIPNNAFRGNTKITSVTAAGNIGSIGQYAFYRSTATFTFNNVTTISGLAFGESLGNITFNDVENMYDGAFQQSSGNITFNDVETIGGTAFSQSSGVLTFNDVGTIGQGAFRMSSGDIIFNDVGTISLQAFQYSSSDITFNDVGTIGGTAFHSSSGDITFNSVGTISSGAFYESESQIYVPHRTSDAKIAEFAAAGYTKTVLKLPPPLYTLTITTAGNGIAKVGGIPYETQRTFEEDDKVVVEFLPDANYRIKSVTVNGIPASRSKIYTINSIEENYNISVEFEEKPPTRIKKVVVKKGRLRIKPIP